MSISTIVPSSFMMGLLSVNPFIKRNVPKAEGIANNEVPITVTIKGIILGLFKDLSVLFVIFLKVS